MMGWESVVIVYKNDLWVCIWFWGWKRVGCWVFKIGDGMNVFIVVISLCGIFVVVGLEGGSIDIYNF